MGKVAIRPLEESDPIFSEGPTRYSPISIRQRLKMMEADLAADNRENDDNLCETTKIKPPPIGKTGER